jgi:hypothetical protein
MNDAAIFPGTRAAGLRLVSTAAFSRCPLKARNLCHNGTLSGPSGAKYQAPPATPTEILEK